MKLSKKFFAIVLALLVAVTALSVGAFAADEVQPTEGKAGINFKKGGTEIVPPAGLDGVYSTNIHFGEWKVTQSAMTYDSLDNELTNDEQYAGFAIFHSNLEDDWQVTVAIKSFVIGDEATMKGFELTLNTDEVIHGDDDINKGPEPTAETGVTIFADAEGGFGDEELIFHAPVGNYGIYGANWSGVLEVPANSAMTVGEATAIMNWSVQKVA